MAARVGARVGLGCGLLRAGVRTETYVCRLAAVHRLLPTARAGVVVGAAGAVADAATGAVVGGGNGSNANGSIGTSEGQHDG